MNNEYLARGSAKQKAFDNPLVDGPHAWYGLLKNFLASSQQRTDAIVLWTVVVLSILMAFALLTDNAYSDEGFHWHQFLEYFDGRFATVDSLTMLPGYHLMVYALSELFSLRDITEVRYASFAIALPALLFFFLTARHYGNSAYPLSLQLFLCPIIFPFFFLIYTDVPALAMVMLSLWLVTIRRYQFAALAIGLSLLIRQPNAVWLGFMWVLCLADTGFFNPPRMDFAGVMRHWLACLRKTWMFCLFSVLFVAFLYINGGVAIGDAGNHQIGLYPTQLFLLLFVLFFLFIPLHVANFPRIIQLLKSNPLWPFAGVMLFAVYIFTFYTDHGYNVAEMDFFLRNNLLALIRENFLTKTLAFIPAVIAFYSIVVTPLRRHSYYWLYPFIMASLLPIGLIEQRYFIIPIALFMLMRKPLGREFEYLQATLYVPFTVYLFEGIYQSRFFI